MYHSKDLPKMKVLSDLSQNCQKVMGIYFSEMLAFLPEALTNMVKSRDSRC